MLSAIKASLKFMTPRERSKWLFLTSLRALLSLLDLVGILAIGYVVTSTAVALTLGSDEDRVLEFVGVEIPAVNSLTLPWVSVGVLALFLVKAMLSLLLTRNSAYFVANVEARSAKAIAEINFSGDLGQGRKRSSEEINYAIQAGSPAAFNVLLNSANALIVEGMLFLVIVLGFFFVEPLAALAAVAYFGFVAFVIQYFTGTVLVRAGQISAESAIRANLAISDLASALRELIVLRKREKYIDLIFRARIDAADSAATQFFLGGIPRYIIEAALMVGVALFVLAQVLSGDIIKSAGTIGVFLSGGFRLTASLLPLQNAFMTISGVIATARTAHEILALDPHNAKASDRTDRTNLSPLGAKYLPIGVSLEGVSYRYPGTSSDAVRQIDFVIEPGQQVALMGTSGAGKSTIADLLCGVLTPSEGVISLTHGSSNKIDASGYGRISYVPQRPGLVSGNILTNVALGLDPELADRERALEALKLANLSDFISQLPNGLDTPLGKMQEGFSGGQLQRLGLARALYTNPGLLVMDEATSALDADSENEIQKVLDQMRGHVTVVLIAHRLNTIQHADRVFLVNDGQVKDSGTFKELVSRNPSVERLVDIMRIEKQ